MSSFFADLDEDVLSPGSLARSASIPANADTTMLDFGEPVRRGMPTNPSEVAVSNYVREEQPTYRSMSVGQPMSALLSPPIEKSEEAGFRNMRSAVQPLTQTVLPTGKHFDVFQKKDAKASPWTTTATTPGAPATVVAPGFSGAPTLPHFLSYGADHFSCSTDIGTLRQTFDSLASSLDFYMELEPEGWGYVFESYPEDEHVMIQARIYQESRSTDFVVDFNRMKGGRQYREELEKIWTFFTKAALCKKGFKKADYFCASLPEFESADENFQIDKSTIELEVETLRSPFLDVRRTGAQLLAGSFKNKAAQNALTECNVVSILIDLLRQSSDDEFDRCLTVALRNALGAFNRDICRHPDALVCLVSKLDGCMNQDASTKVEVGRNCARVLIALASDEESKELIRGNRGGDVAKKISNDSRNNAHLISLSRTLCTALTASSF
jgi:hypothetical protein|eukprot:Stramenopile-MAST_4_protein_3820